MGAPKYPLETKATDVLKLIAEFSADKGGWEEEYYLVPPVIVSPQVTLLEQASVTFRTGAAKHARFRIGCLSNPVVMTKSHVHLLGSAAEGLPVENVPWPALNNGAVPPVYEFSSYNLRGDTFKYRFQTVYGQGKTANVRGISDSLITSNQTLATFVGNYYITDPVGSVPSYSSSATNESFFGSFIRWLLNNTLHVRINPQGPLAVPIVGTDPEPYLTMPWRLAFLTKVGTRKTGKGPSVDPGRKKVGR